MIRYSSYGVPFGLPAGDADSDGDCDNGDSTDTNQIQTWIDTPSYDMRGDIDLDGRRRRDGQGRGANGCRNGTYGSKQREQLARSVWPPMGI